MKKWLGMICSAVMGIFAFVFVSFNNLFYKTSTGKMSFTGYELIKESGDGMPKGYGCYKVFTIIMLVVAALLIAWAIVMLLNNLGVLKFKFNLNLVNTILISVFAAASIIAFICLIVMGADIASSSTVVKLTSGPSIGAYLNLLFALVACACSAITLVKKKA